VIPVPPGVRVLIATRPIDFRKGADSLAALAKETLAQDPFAGAVLVFRSRRADRVKILVWDGSGLVLVWKRLEQGAFKWPPITHGVMRQILECDFCPVRSEYRSDQLVPAARSTRPAR
jgi:transposase